MILHPLVSDKEIPSGGDLDIFEALNASCKDFSDEFRFFFGKVEFRLLHSGWTHLPTIHEKFWRSFFASKPGKKSDESRVE